MGNINLSKNEAYKILVVSSNATKEEIEAAYKKLLIKYHPDKFAAKSEQEKKEAEEKLSEIKTARDIALNNCSCYSGNTSKTNYEKHYSKNMTKEEYDEFLQREYDNLKRMFEEFKRRDEEEYQAFKRKIIRSLFSIQISVFIFFLGVGLLKNNVSGLIANLLDNSKINKDDSSLNSSKNYLTKIHKVTEKDTLEELAYEANCTEEEIISLNGNIEVENEIKIPYNIIEEDLDYYIETITYNKKQNLEEIAKEYNTDLETLKKLNSESIIEMGKITVIIGDNLKVPNFISKQDLKVKKEATKVYTK